RWRSLTTRRLWPPEERTSAASTSAKIFRALITALSPLYAFSNDLVSSFSTSSYRLNRDSGETDRSSLAPCVIHSSSRRASTRRAALSMQSACPTRGIGFGFRSRLGLRALGRFATEIWGWPRRCRPVYLGSV